MGELREPCGVTRGSVEESENGSTAAGLNRCRFAARSWSSGGVGLGDAAGAAGGDGEHRCFFAGVSSLRLGLSLPSGGSGPGGAAGAAGGGGCGPRCLLAAGSSVPVGTGGIIGGSGVACSAVAGGSLLPVRVAELPEALAELLLSRFENNCAGDFKVKGGTKSCSKRSRKGLSSDQSSSMLFVVHCAAFTSSLEQKRTA